MWSDEVNTEWESCKNTATNVRDLNLNPDINHFQQCLMVLLQIRSICLQAGFPTCLTQLHPW